MKLNLNILMKFREFLRAEIDRKELSVRKFAEKSGINHQTLNKFLDYSQEEAGLPSLETLAKLSRFTNTDVRTIVGMLLPDYTHDISPNAMLWAERIDRLPKDTQDVIDKVILAMLLGQENKRKDDSEIGGTEAT